MCDNVERQDQILGYLYDELEPAARQVFEGHVTACAACRSELAALEATQGHLAAWAIPEPVAHPPGLRLVSPEPAPLPRWRLRAWGLAAAAMLVLGVSAALANLEVRIGSDGLVVRTGWSQPPSSVAPVAEMADAAPAATPTPDWQAALAAVQARLDEIEADAFRPGPAVLPVAGTRMSDADLLRRVRDIVAQSEERQERAIMGQFRQVMLEYDRQRRAELAYIQQGMTQFHGLTNAEMAQQRETLNQLVRVRQEK